jgi:acetate kinase
MKILVINAGSSSLKYQLIDMQGEAVLAKGLAERIGIEGSKLTHQYGDQKYVVEQPMKSHTDAMQLVLEALIDPRHGVITAISEIGAVGHRGCTADKFNASCVIDEPVEKAIED